MTKYYCDAAGNYIGGFDKAAPPAGAVEVPFAPPSAAHVWKGGKFELPLTDVKKKTRANIIAARDAEITGGFPYLGKTIDSDRDSVMSITGAGVAALAAKSAGIPYSVTWTCADDSTIVLDADGVLGMVVALAMFADAQHAKARPLKDAIKNAKTPEDINKVKW